MKTLPLSVTEGRTIKREGFHPSKVGQVTESCELVNGSGNTVALIYISLYEIVVSEVSSEINTVYVYTIDNDHNISLMKM